MSSANPKVRTIHYAKFQDVFVEELHTPSTEDAWVAWHEGSEPVMGTVGQSAIGVVKMEMIRNGPVNSPHYKTKHGPNKPNP